MATTKKAALTTELIASALKATGGSQAGAGRRLRVDRSAICKRVQKSRLLQSIQRQARESLIDEAETGLLKSVKRGKGWAVCFTLKTLGKDRGYIERQEITGVDGQPFAAGYFVGPSKLTDVDEWERAIQTGNSDGNGKGNDGGNGKTHPDA